MDTPPAESETGFFSPSRFLPSLIADLRKATVDSSLPIPQATPLLLFKILLEAPDVRRFMAEKGIKRPEALARHVERIIAQREQGTIAEGGVHFSFGTDDPLRKDMIAHGRDELRQELRVRRLQSHDASPIPEFTFAPGVFELISGYVADTEMQGDFPNVVGLFQAALKVYHEALGESLKPTLDKLIEESSTQEQGYAGQVRRPAHVAQVADGRP